MPLREIRKKFTKSELFMLAWRSQEQAVKMKSKFREDAVDVPRYQSPSEDEPDEGEAVKLPQPKRRNRRKAYEDSQVPEGLPSHFYNKDGELDLRQVTGDEAYRFFAAQGIQLPIIPT